MLCKLIVECWACFTADIAWIWFFWPVDSRHWAHQWQTSGYLWEFCLYSLSTADVGPFNGRRQATFDNFVCLARWRQMSGPSTADVGLHFVILSVGPVDGRCRARRRQMTICHRQAPDERRCRFCRAPNTTRFCFAKKHEIRNRLILISKWQILN